MDKRTYSEEITLITDQLISLYKPKKVILFGSAARGDFGDDSDLDFLVIKDDRETHLAVEQKLHRMINYSLATDFIFLRPEEVDLKVAQGDLFLTQILEEGKVLYG